MATREHCTRRYELAQARRFERCSAEFTPKGMPETMAPDQCVLGLLVQAKMNSEIGRMTAPTIIIGRRCSGSA